MENSEIIQELVNAKVKLALNDNPPQTIEVDKEKVIATLTEMEEEIRGKYRETVKAWRKSYKAYMTHLQKNPGSNAVRDPGPEPELDSGIESLRGWIRAFECVSGNTIRLSRTEWSGIFQRGSETLVRTRNSRDGYLSLLGRLVEPEGKVINR